MEPFILEKSTSLLRISEWEQEVEGLQVGFTTRMGGVSNEQYFSMNCGLHVGDNDQDVVTNRQILSRSLQFPFDQWTCAEQIHSNQVVIVGEGERGKGAYTRSDAIQDTDGLITSKRDVLLTSFYADCVPLFFLAPSNSIIGIAHAGWKGTASNIAFNMLDGFKSHFGVEPSEIKVAIGPSISECCYEVDERVIREISLNIIGDDKSFYREKESGKYLLDLKKANHILLNEAGVLTTNILSSSWCTSCREDMFFSYRKENGKTGRMAAFIGLNKGCKVYGSKGIIGSGE